MGKPVSAVVIAPERSIIKKVIWLLIGVGVLIYVGQSPGEAASVVRTVVSAVTTFIRSL